MTKILNQNISLNNHFNIMNSVNLANDLTKLEIQENHRLITFDIKDLYVNVPICETLDITKNIDYYKTAIQI